MYVGEKVTVKVTTDEVRILSKGTIIASYQRIYGRYQDQIKLDHYLELLLQKSRALSNTKVYKPHMLAPVYEQYRRNLNARSQKGNREFVKILMLHRDYPPVIVTEAVGIAMAYNVYSYDGCIEHIRTATCFRKAQDSSSEQGKASEYPRSCCNTS